MTEHEKALIKLECLKLAMQGGALDLISRADELYQFVIKKSKL